MHREFLCPELLQKEGRLAEKKVRGLLDRFHGDRTRSTFAVCKRRFHSVAPACPGLSTGRLRAEDSFGIHLPAVKTV
jgi:hypothetical protein